MKFTTMVRRLVAAAAATGAVLLLASVPAMAQDNAPRPLLAPVQLDNLVSRIALYPDPLLAQVLAAATFANDIPDAARWAYDHQNLCGNDLSQAIGESNLPWDPSVQALLPFPDVLDTMARDMNWTAQLGDAFLAQRDEVMDAVQRMRRVAQSYGYLRSGEQFRVIADPSYIQILPYDPAMIYVPVYDPYVVYAPPRPGFYIGAAIGFRGYFLGVAFGRWGWGGGFDWRSHAVIVYDRVWDRTWSNRTVYAVGGGNRNTGNIRREVAVDNRQVIADRVYRPAAPPARVDNAVRQPAFERGANGNGNAYRPAAPAPRVDNTYRRDNVRQNAPPLRESVRTERGGNAPARETRGAEKGFRR